MLAGMLRFKPPVHRVPGLHCLNGRTRREKKLEQKALHRRMQEEMIQRVHVLMARSRIVDTGSAAAAAMVAVATGGADVERLSATVTAGQHDATDREGAERSSQRAELDRTLPTVEDEAESLEAEAIAADEGEGEKEEDDDYVDATQPCDAPATPFVLRTVSGRLSGVVSGSRAARPPPGSGRESSMSVSRSGGPRRSARSPRCEWAQRVGGSPAIDVTTYTFAEQGEEEEEILESSPVQQEEEEGEEEEGEEEEDEAMVSSTQLEYMGRTERRSSVGSICRCISRVQQRLPPCPTEGALPCTPSTRTVPPD